MSETILSQQTTHQFNFAESVESAFAKREESMHARLVEVLGSKQAASRAIAHVSDLVELMKERASRYREHSIGVDLEVGDDDAQRDGVGQAHQKLDATGRAVRAKLRAFVGKAHASSRYHVGQMPPANRQHLRQWAERVAVALTQYPVKLTDEFGATFDSAPLLHALTRDRDAFIEALDALGRDERETQDARTRRDQSEQEFIVALRAASATLQTLFALCGMDEAASRVAPTWARLRGEGGNKEPGAPA